MDAVRSTQPLVWKDGRLHEGSRTAGSLAALCAAIEQTVKSHRTSGVSVRAVILMLDDPPAMAKAETAPVYVDVYDSGYGHGI